MPPQTATGVFKDSNVSGMSFESGGQTGETDAGGNFTYEVGQDVIFSVGGVIVGSAAGADTVTPLDLVPGATSTTTEVVNIVRFLLMLDTDGDPTNGITISAAVRTAAENWAAIDFDDVDFDNSIATIISDAASADGTPHDLPGATAAQTHLESTLLCLHAGAYTGTFSGDDSGPFGVLVDAGTGLVVGAAFSTEDQALLALTGSTSVSFDQDASFISGNTSSGSTFEGNFSGAGAVSGTWNSTIFNTTGTFTGTRLGGDSQAAHRFTGAFDGDAIGLFTFDVDASGNVSGNAYTAIAIDEPGLVVDEVIGVSGTVTGDQLSATTSDGDGMIVGTMDRAAGTLVGTWSDSEGGMGTFAGSGCQLN